MKNGHLVEKEFKEFGLSEVDASVLCAIVFINEGTVIG